MKKTAYFFIAVAVFAGAFGALQLNQWLGRRQDLASLADDVSALPTASLADDPLTGAPKDFSDAAAKVLPSVVSVDNLQTETNFWNDQTSIQKAATGSGVILTSSGIIVTNNHVVTGATEVRVRLSDKRVYMAKVIGTDRRGDLAVLKINATGLTPIQMGDSDKIRPGQWAMAVGNPLDFAETVSVGVVSNSSRTLPTQNGGIMFHAIQTDAAINPGNSGGALTDAQGRLIGINSAIISPTGSSIGIGFAIPINHVRRVVQDILKYGHSMEGVLGLVPRPGWDGLLSDPDARQELAQVTGSSNVPKQGLVIPYPDNFKGYGLVAGYPAAAAGMRPLDIIISIDGAPVTDQISFMAALADKRAGQSVKIQVWSKGSVKTLNVTLASETTST